MFTKTVFESKRALAVDEKLYNLMKTKSKAVGLNKFKKSISSRNFKSVYTVYCIGISNR